MCAQTHWVVDFRVVSMLLPHLLIVLLLFPSFLLIQRFQVFPSVVLFHHFVPFELVMSLFVIVLQIFCGLDARKIQLHTQVTQVKPISRLESRLYLFT